MKRERQRKRETFIIRGRERPSGIRPSPSFAAAAAAPQGGRHGIRHCGRLRISRVCCVAPHAACVMVPRVSTNIHVTAAAPHRRLVLLARCWCSGEWRGETRREGQDGASSAAEHARPETAERAVGCPAPEQRRRDVRERARVSPARSESGV